MLPLSSKIKSLAKLYLAETIEIRRHLHSYPELSFQEYKTSDYIASKLKEYNIPFSQGIVKTGIVALIKGTKPTPSPLERAGVRHIAIRADMDALPITELNTCDYKSKNI